MARHPLKGSERQPYAGAHAVGKADPAERFEVSVLLRRRAAADLTAQVRKMTAGDRSAAHLSRDDFAKRFGAEEADIAAVQKFAQAHGLAVVQSEPARRTVVLSGTVAQFNAAFGVDLQTFEHPGGTYRGRTGAVQLPDELGGVVEAVMGLDNRPAAKPHFRARGPQARAGGAAPAASSFTPLALAAAYGFPAGTGQGQTIAIIELGGGYKTADLKAYFAELKLAVPKITAVSVDHGKNHATGSPNGPDGEVMLDIEVAGAIAPAAHLAVYFAPNTDAGFLDAITTAIHDTKNKPSVVSISWGGPEPTWTAQSLAAYDQAFQSAAALGVTVCVAAGDGGSGDGQAGDNVDFPASSPHVLACGGTSLQVANGKISSESVWNDGAGAGATGGGVSTVFALPAWQAGLQVTRTGGAARALQMRGVPDVAGDADPQTGYQVRVDGTSAVFGGTSAVAPLWAGLVARINATKGSPAGFINPRLYANPSALRDITSGNNGDFAASKGWDAATGLGSPNGPNLSGVIG